MKESNKGYARMVAMKRVERLRKFYTHIMAYVIITIAILLVRVLRDHIYNDLFDIIMSNTILFFVWLGWSIGLIVHAFILFILPLFIGKDWKEKKIREFMNEENENKF